MLQQLKQFLDENPDWLCVAELFVYPPTADELREEFPEADQEVVQRCNELVLMGRIPVTRGTLYVKSRRNGNSHSFAAVCAMQRSAWVDTDDVWWGGRKHFADVYGEQYFNEVKELLAKQGVTLGAHQEYMPELAEFKGDTRAVVGHGGRSHIKKVLEERGVVPEGGGIRGLKAREPEHDPYEGRPGLAADLVQENFENFAAENPDEARKMSSQDVAAHMEQQHGLPG